MKRALVLIKVSPKSTSSVFNKISKMPEVKESMQIYGEYDAMFLINVKDVEEIQKFIQNIRKINGVLSTNTMIEL